MKTFKILFLLMGALVFVAQISAAQDLQTRQITGDKLRSLFLEKTVISEYRGVTTGIQNYQFTELHNTDGSTDYIELGQAPVKGLWDLVGQDKICYRYPQNPTFPGTYCFIVYKIDSCYYNYSTNIMTVRGPRNWDNWTSRFVVKGDGGTCGDALS